MNLFGYLLIGIFGSASYAIGGWQISQGNYKPSIFSRVIWLLLALNSFIGVVASKGSTSSTLLAGIFLVGNALICLLSIWRGARTMGNLEWVCLGLLSVSGGLWLVIDAPLINLGIGLLAHLIGALPTYARVWKDGSAESTAFWSLFFIASILSIVVSFGEPLQKILFPIYFVVFDGSMTLLSLRRKKS